MSGRRLLFNRIGERFDPQLEHPFYVECFLGREERLGDWRRWRFSEPYRGYTDFAAMERDWRRLRDFAYRQVVPRFQERVREARGIERGPEYWKTLLNGWLLTLLAIAWSRYRQLEQFIEDHPGECFRVELIDPETRWHFSDTQAFMRRAAVNVDFHHWLLSLIAEELAPAEWVLERRGAAPGAERCDAQPRGGARQRVRALVERVLDLRWSRCRGVYGLNLPEQVAASLLLWFKRGVVNVQAAPSLDPVEVLPERFVAVAERVVERCIPDSLLDGHLPVAAGRTPWWVRPGAFRLIGPYLFFDDRAKATLALARELGEKIICTQHGGYPGRLCSLGLPREVELRQDYYLSWGWDRYGDAAGRIVPLPTPHLSGLKRARRRRAGRGGGGIVMIGAHMEPLLLRLFSMPYGSQWLEYREEKMGFLRGVGAALRGELIYRPFVADTTTSFRDAEHVREAFPELRIVDGSARAAALIDQMLEARLIVVDHPISALNIALAMEVPTIAFWRDEHWCIHQDARPWFDELARAGIRHSSGESAAAQLLAVADDPRRWWDGDAVRRAREAWCERFARTSDGWRGEWFRAVRSFE
ncbi:LIC12162 family transferase [Endothiovibrio diazotrophicus]